MSFKDELNILQQKQLEEANRESANQLLEFVDMVVNEIKNSIINRVKATSLLNFKIIVSCKYLDKTFWGETKSTTTSRKSFFFDNKSETIQTFALSKNALEFQKLFKQELNKNDLDASNWFTSYLDTECYEWVHIKYDIKSWLSYAFIDDSTLHYCSIDPQIPYYHIESFLYNTK